MPIFFKSYFLSYKMVWPLNVIKIELPLLKDDWLK